ncbi:MAG: hypothetical protein EOO14_08030 [Chitinophagaceae bacterium]|nr:MAG: hypothetical protein EOO14_08030 [Chitinophagaceae bacterium]
MAHFIEINVYCFGNKRKKNPIKAPLFRRFFRTSYSVARPDISGVFPHLSQFDSILFFCSFFSRTIAILVCAKSGKYPDNFPNTVYSLGRIFTGDFAIHPRVTGKTLPCLLKKGINVYSAALQLETHAGVIAILLLTFAPIESKIKKQAFLGAILSPGMLGFRCRAAQLFLPDLFRTRR